MPTPASSSILPTGAAFLRADLQIHTPLDNRFKLPSGFSTDTEAERRRIGGAYIEAATKAGVDILGITEHNDLTYFPYIRDAATGSAVTVVPGVEFTLSPNWHVIAIFEPTANVEKLWDCIVQMGLGRPPDDRFHPDGSPKASPKTLSDALQIIARFGGIVFAPHACGNLGLLNLPSGQHRVDCWREPLLLAADPGSGKRVESLGDFERGAFENSHDLYRRSHPIAPLWTSDARALSGIGRFSTWIKVGAPTIEAFRQAFLDPGSRIRHPEDYTGSPYPRIVELSWEGEGFLSGEHLRLNPNLNCLIGGKGSGKSSIVESLRFAFDMVAPQAQRDQQRSLVQRVLPRGSSVRVVVETGEPQVRYVVQRHQGNPPVVTDQDGTLLIDTKPVDVQPLSLFGQKEIYEIALQPSNQLELLDSFIGDGVLTAQEREAEILEILSRNGRELTTLEQKDAELEGKLKSLPRLRAMKKRYETLGLAAQLQRKTKIAARFAALKRARASVATFQSELAGVPTLDDPGAAKIVGDEPLSDLLAKANEVVGSVASDWTTAVKNVTRKAKDAERALDALLVEAKGVVENEDRAFEQGRAELESQFPGVHINEYLSLERNIAEIEPLATEREKVIAKMRALEQSRQSNLQKLLDIRTERYRLRSEKAAELSARLKGILQISVTFQNAAPAMLAYLESLKLGARKAALEQLVLHANFAPGDFLVVVGVGAESLAEVFDIPETLAAKLVEAITAERKREIEILEIEDAISIEFNVGTPVAPLYRGLNDISVGQKSTAILLLLLLKDDTPFIVDQPEDDLDNRFIYEDVVTRLRASKERRQFIVATHNANIPVLGDAEQIVVLSASSNKGTISATGSIDSPAIQDHVKHILEGGSKAFELRRMKYGF